MEQKQKLLAPELAPRLAAIDIGSNSIRLIIAEGLRDGKYRILDDEKEATRLGRNLEATGQLDPAAVDLSVLALRRMKQIVDGYQVDQIKTIATCAVREASDGEDFCRRVREEVGLDVEVISSQREAQLAFTSVARNTNLDGKNVAVADIGGGSAEIILASGNVVEQIFSSPLGAVRISEMYQAAQAMTPDRFAQLLAGTERILRKHTRKPVFVPHVLIGSGGTFTTLASIIMTSRGQTGLPIRGYRITLADVRHVLDRLRKMSVKSRRGVPGLSPDRADIIVGGLAIIDCLMRRFKVNVLQVHDGGVRDGLLLTMVDPQPTAGQELLRSRQGTLEAFASGCGVDVTHCRHVAQVARSIYRQLGQWYELPADDQELLYAAAQLQDVGYLINYDKHHKHSYHLILNSNLPGFRPEELELIANVARYHRGSEPKRKHGHFQQLTEDHQLRVRQMAAILRLAGGFDRSHTQQVEDVVVERHGGELRLYARSSQLPEVNLWGAKRRVGVFEDVFDARVKVDWLSPEHEKAGAAAAAESRTPARAAGASRKRTGRGGKTAVKTDPRDRTNPLTSRA